MFHIKTLPELYAKQLVPNETHSHLWKFLERRGGYPSKLLSHNPWQNLPLCWYPVYAGRTERQETILAIFLYKIRSYRSSIILFKCTYMLRCKCVITSSHSSRLIVYSRTINARMQLWMRCEMPYPMGLSACGRLMDYLTICFTCLDWFNNITLS